MSVLVVRHHALTNDTIAVVIAVSSGHPHMEVVLVVASEVIAVAVEAIMVEVAVVCTYIHVIDAGNSIIEVVAVAIALVDAEDEVRPGIIDGTIEILPLQEPFELAAAQHIAEVLVTDIEQIVIVVDCIVITEDHVVDDFVDVPKEVVVDLIDINPLFTGQIQFVAHPVGKEASFATNLHGAEHCASIQIDGCQDHHH